MHTNMAEVPELVNCGFSPCAMPSAAYTPTLIWTFSWVWFAEASLVHWLSQMLAPMAAALWQPYRKQMNTDSRGPTALMYSRYTFVFTWFWETGQAAGRTCTAKKAWYGLDTLLHFRYNYKLNSTLKSNLEISENKEYICTRGDVTDWPCPFPRSLPGWVFPSRVVSSSLVTLSVSSGCSRVSSPSGIWGFRHLPKWYWSVCEEGNENNERFLKWLLKNIQEKAARALNDQIITSNQWIKKKQTSLISNLKGSSKTPKVPYKLPLCFVDHRLIVNHVCVVAKGIIREQILIFELICNNIECCVIQSCS